MQYLKTHKHAQIKNRYSPAEKRTQDSRQAGGNHYAAVLFKPYYYGLDKQLFLQPVSLYMISLVVPNYLHTVYKAISPTRYVLVRNIKFSFPIVNPVESKTNAFDTSSWDSTESAVSRIRLVIMAVGQDWLF